MLFNAQASEPAVQRIVQMAKDNSIVKAAAKALVGALDTVDPARKVDYEKGEAQFLESLKPLDAKMAEMRKYLGQPITASEPVFRYQAGLIGLEVHNEKFALAVMNNAESNASEVAGFENDLKGHKVKAPCFSTPGASEPAVQRLVQMAKDNSSASPRPSRWIRPISSG